MVKRLGDGVMFVSTDAETACRLALDLVAAFAPPAPRPPVRVGLAAGPVAALRGDFFGPAVHLAARIVGATPTGTAAVSTTSANAHRRSAPPARYGDARRLRRAGCR